MFNDKSKNTLFFNNNEWSWNGIISSVYLPEEVYSI